MANADLKRVALVEADVRHVEAVLVKADAIALDVALGVDEVAVQRVAAPDVRGEGGLLDNQVETLEGESVGDAHLDVALHHSPRLRGRECEDERVVLLPSGHRRVLVVVVYGFTVAAGSDQCNRKKQ